MSSYISIDVDMSKMINKLNNIRNNAPTDYLENLKKRVKAKTPVKSGKLRAGWSVSGLTLDNAMPYAGFVEFGTRYQSAQLMLTMSVMESQQDWVSAIKKNWV